jgi:hypothetical protein
VVKGTIRGERKAREGLRDDGIGLIVIQGGREPRC